MSADSEKAPSNVSGDSKSDSSQPKAEPHEHPQFSSVREALFITVLCSTQLFVQGSFGYILIPLRIVGNTFGQSSEADAPKLAWHVAGYSLTVGTFILIAGRLGDIHGSKKILVSGWIWFGAWSLIGGCSAFTASAVFFDIARAFQGIGPAFLLPNALAIAGRTYPPGMKKNIVFSVFALTAPLGCCSAGLIGSALAQYLWWPWVMWIYTIGCFSIAVLAVIVIPQDNPNTLQRGQSFDSLGALAGVVGLLLLNIR